MAPPTTQCACRGGMTVPGTEHTATACAVIPFAIAQAIYDAMTADRPLNDLERARVDAWLIERGDDPQDWAPILTPSRR